MWMAQQYASVEQMTSMSRRVDVVEQVMIKVSAQDEVIIEKLGYINGKIESQNTRNQNP